MLTAAAAVAPFAYGHPFFPFFFVVPLFWLLVIAAVVLLAVRGRRRRLALWGPESSRAAEQTLSERFARGDIEEQEYRARLEVLRAARPPLR